jgi:hypothetical protein
MSVGRRSSRWVAALCVAVTATAGGVSACSKKDSESGKPSQSQSAADTPSAKPSKPVTGTGGQLPTLGDYIKQNNITEAPAKHDDPGVPKIELPMPPGWADAGPGTPSYAYNAIVGVDPALQPDPPTVVAVLSKLTGDVDPAQILALAPNEIRNLPDFSGSDPQKGKLSNFDDVAISGKYTRNGKPRVIEQTTAVIPVKDGMYVLQINVDGVMQVVDAIGQKATITVEP